MNPGDADSPQSAHSPKPTGPALRCRSFLFCSVIGKAGLLEIDAELVAAADDGGDDFGLFGVGLDFLTHPADQYIDQTIGRGIGVLSDVYIVGDDDAAKKEFLSLVGDAPFRFVEAGCLANARFVERMTLFATELSQRYGYFPRANWKFLGEPWEMGQSDSVAHLIARDEAPQ